MTLYCPVACSSYKGFEAGVLAMYSLPRARGLRGAGVESPSPAPFRRGSHFIGREPGWEREGHDYCVFAIA